MEWKSNNRKKILYMSHIKRELLVNLKVIGKVAQKSKQNPCKLSLSNGEASLDPENSFSWLSRKWRGDSRAKTVVFITNTYDKVLDLVHLLSQSAYLPSVHRRDISRYERKQSEEILQSLTTIRDTLAESILGVQSLKTCYAECSNIEQKLDLEASRAESLVVECSRTIENVSKLLFATGATEDKRSSDATPQDAERKESGAQKPRRQVSSSCRQPPRKKKTAPTTTTSRPTPTALALETAQQALKLDTVSTGLLPTHRV